MEQTRGSHNGHSAVHPLDGTSFDFNKAKEQLSDLNDKAIDLIKQRPVAVLLGAVCLGFIVGRLISRS